MEQAVLEEFDKIAQTAPNERSLDRARKLLINTHAFSMDRMRPTELIEIWQTVSCPVLCLNGSDGFRIDGWSVPMPGVADDARRATFECMGHAIAPLKVGIYI